MLSTAEDSIFSSTIAAGDGREVAAAAAAAACQAAAPAAAAVTTNTTTRDPTASHSLQFLSFWECRGFSFFSEEVQFKLWISFHSN